MSCSVTPVRLEPVALRSQVKHSTTEPLRSHFKFEPVVQEEMSLKDISYLELWQPLCSVERNHLFNFGGRHHEEQFYLIILKLF